MKILIETPRLIIRKFVLDDVDEVYQFATHPKVTLYTGDAETINTFDDVRNLITGIWLAEYKKYGYARYALVHIEDNKVIGFCGIKYEPKEQRPDIGYRMLPEYWGQGLGYEAALATLNYAREVLKLDNIYAEAVVENIASNKILLKIGLKPVDRYQSEGFEVIRYE